MIWQYSAEGSVSGIYGRVDMNEGYFDIDQPITKSVSDIAHEVIAGLWGNGNDRLERLTNAGYDYAVIQNEVNKIMSRKSVTEIAREVIAGKWGNGDDRKTRLENADYYYWEIQAEVNRILSGGR